MTRFFRNEFKTGRLRGSGPRRPGGFEVDTGVRGLSEFGTSLYEGGGSLGAEATSGCELLSIMVTDLVRSYVSRTMHKKFSFKFPRVVT